MTTTTTIPDSDETPVFTAGVQKILIVDDKTANLFAMENVLEYLDAEVIRATSGQAALAQVLEHDFSVIILDVRMPGMDGYEVAGHLKGDPQTKTIPIIFVTAEYPDEEHISKGYEFGAIDYLLKPYSPKILLSKVKVLLEMDRNKNELKRHRDQLESQVLERTAKLNNANIELQSQIIERQQAVLALEENQKALLEAQSIALLGSYTLDIPSGRWKSSDMLDELFGIDKGYDRSVEGWEALIHPDERAMMSDYLKNEIIGNQKFFNKEYRIIRQTDQAERWVLGLGRLECDDTAMPVKMIGTIQDITERKQVEMELKHRDEDLKESQRIAQLGNWRMDLSTEQITWSEELYKMYGFDPSLPPPPFAEHNTIFTPESWDTLSKALTKTLETEVPYELELRTVRIDGSHGWMWVRGEVVLDAKGDAVALRGVARDITERKQAEAEKEMLMAAINQAAESILITDKQGRIQYVNPAFERITGYSREEIIGKTPRILKSGEHSTPFYKQIWETILKGETWSGKIVNRKKNGSLYTEEVTIAPMKDDSGSIVNFVSVKRDVTSVLEMEEQIRQSQKMESIGQLVGGVAHDFNNLLQIINGYTEIARMMLEPEHPAAAGIEEVFNAGTRAKDLVRQLLAFSRQQVIDPTYIDLNEEIENAKKMLGRVIGEHILLEFIPGTDLGKVYADKGQINQVLMNLCVNARDAMPDGGSLTLKTEDVMRLPDDLTPQEEISAEGYNVLSIMDTGCGMGKETCKKVFEPFFTTKEMGKGTGLGLSTVYGIVKQNKGHITVTSEPGQGTTFTVYFPVVKEEEEAVGEGTNLQDAMSFESGSETILMAEDEDILLKLATQFLSEAGYTVMTAKDGEEAVQVFTEHADEIDMVMMDVVMPHMGGEKAIQEILKIRSDLRYLFVSGYSPDAGHNNFIKAKDLNLLNKPYDAKTLLKKVREVLDREMPEPVEN